MKAHSFKTQLALGRRGSRVHVPAAVEVVVDLGSASEHAGIKEDRERARLESLLGQFTVAVGLPQHLEEQSRDHCIDIDAVDIARHPAFVERPDEFLVVRVEDVVILAAPEQLVSQSYRLVRLSTLISRLYKSIRFQIVPARRLRLVPYLQALYPMLLGIEHALLAHVPRLGCPG